MISRQPVGHSLAAAVFAGLSLLATASVRADVKLPAVLSDHMVLQQQMPVPIWGSADAGEEVTVAFADQKQTTKADDKGHWEVKLPPLTASDKPANLTVTGKNTVELKDILVGEVWICSGQSNMEFGIANAADHEKEVAAADHPLIRLFTVPKNVQAEPQTDLTPQPPFAAKWLLCSPETVVQGVWGGFSAVGYFFGRDLEKDLKVPIGLIHTSWGGTPAESWTAHSYLEGDPDLKSIDDQFDFTSKDLPKKQQQYEKALEKWKEADEKAKADHKPRPKKPKAPTDALHNPWRPSGLYNGMIAPIVPFAVKGAIWYQGEANASRGYQYRKLLPAMIKLRDNWQEPALDFYIVSLANFQDPVRTPGESDWAELRQAQALTAAQPHNGQALAIDLADAKNPGDIHPHNKQEVGRRLELVALAKTYGKTVEYSGPQYKDSKIEGNKVILQFDFAEGLIAKGSDSLKGFQIAGEDKKWHWADAKIEGSSIVVESKDVEKPAAVRYDWANNPQGNLYNKADLPAVPFRTDDWRRDAAK